MASATMHTHHQLDGQPSRSEGNLAIELGAGCAPNSAYLQPQQHHHHHHHSQQFHHNQQHHHLQEHSNQNHYASAQFYNPEQSARAVVSAAMSAHLHQEAGEQFYYQQASGSTSQESVYQQLYGTGSSEPNNGYSLAGPASTNYALNQHYEVSNGAHLSADQHSYSSSSYPPFVQSFNRASTDSNYQSYSSYAASGQPAAAEQSQLGPTGSYRQLSVETNQGHRSIDSNQSRTSINSSSNKLDDEEDEKSAKQRHQQVGSGNLSQKQSNHILIELETSANNKRCQQQRRSISSGETTTELEEENNQFQEVASARKQRKKTTNKYSKTITLNELELLDNSNQRTNNVRDFCALNNHERVSGVYAETAVKNTHHHHHLEDNHHHSSLWSSASSSTSGNIRHYNQLGADLLSRPQLEQSPGEVNKGKCAPEQAATFLGSHNSLSWFQKGAAASLVDEHSSSAGGLQPPANEYQPGYSSAAGPEQAYQLLAAKVGRQNVAAGGKIRGGGGGSEGATSELEVEELHEPEVAAPAAGQLEVGSKQRANAESNNSNEYNQLRILEMRKEKSRDAARSRRSKENHEFYELAKLLPLPAAITSQLDFLDKASIIRLTISFLKLRQFSVNGHPPWAPDFTTLGSVNPYSSQSLSNYAESSHYPASSSTSSIQVEAPFGSSTSDYATGQQRIEPTATPRVCLDRNQAAAAAEKSTVSPSKSAATIFDIHQGTHILQSLDGFAFAIGRDGRFLYISETVSMYLGLSQVEMTGSSVFDYTHQQDHEELARQLGIPCSSSAQGLLSRQKGDLVQQQLSTCESPTAPNSVHSQYSAASNETMIEDYVNHTNACGRSNKHAKARAGSKHNFSQRNKRVKQQCTGAPIKIEPHQPQRPPSPAGLNHQGRSSALNGRKVESKQSLTCPDQAHTKHGTDEDPLVRQFCIRMKSTLTKRGCQHFKSSGYRVVHVVAHLRSYQSNDHGHLMDPLDEIGSPTNEPSQRQHCLPASSSGISAPTGKLKRARQLKSTTSKTSVAGKATSSVVSPAINESCQPFTTSDTNSGESNSRSVLESQQTQQTSQSAAQMAMRSGFSKSNNEEKIIGMVAVAIALPPPSINELRLESGTFVLRLNLELGITHIEPKITELLHYPVELIAGRSLYSLVHPADVQQVQKCHKELLKKGQMMSGYYRLLARTGGYIWIQSCATMICNNTYNAAASSQQSQPHSQPITILPATLSSSPGVSTTPIGLNQPVAIGQAPTLVNVYNLDSSNQYNKMASPGLSSSQLSSSFDNQDQDQCVIFVNYMVTNIVDETEIVDICQSPNYTPLMTSFSGTTSSTTNNNNNLFNSPSPACSSPCISSLRPNGSGQGQHHNQNSSDTSYVPPTTPSSNASLSSPRRHHHHQQQQHQHQHHHQLEGKSAREHIKAINGRRATHKSSKYLSNPAPAGDENGHEHLSNSFITGVATEQHQQHIKLHPNGQLGGANQATGAYSYSQTPGSVNLALNKVAMAGNESSWLAHQPGAGGRLLADPVAVYSQQAPEANNQYAAYKAAFNLTDYNQQQQQQQHEGGYPNSGNATVAAVYPAASVPVNSWETAATVAAVAAASANHHLSQHHHHQSTGANPYAHLEHTHHHHHQHSHLSSAGAAASNHHNPASSYYNYYGYYGNKFI